MPAGQGGGVVRRIIVDRKPGIPLWHLVVAMVIIVLCALAFHRVAWRVASKAYAISCLANIKQLQLMALMYDEDWDHVPAMYF